MANLISKKELINEIEKALYSDELAVFAGAGLSIDSGYCSWTELLKEPASELGLDVKKEEHDLVSLAQFYCNTKKRRAINDLLSTSFPTNLKRTENHILLAQLPITTYWTTNYDTLLEDALKENNKNVSVRKIDKDLQLSSRNYDSVVYKMHGDIYTPSEAIITRDDYEAYGINDRRLFKNVLEGNLLTKTFLFLGFSFNDPNFNSVISKMRVLLSDDSREHFCILKKVVVPENPEGEGNSENEEYERIFKEYEYNQIKQKLQIENLERYGVRIYLVDEYEEITKMLRIILNRYKRKTVFISGSAEEYSPMSKQDAENFIRKLSFRLVQNGYRIVNGYGKGIGTFVINGVTEYCYHNKNIKIEDSLKLMPFPLSAEVDKKLLETWKKYREEMISQCGIAIFMFGNMIKCDELINANGVKDEFDIAKSYDVITIPLSFTGSISQELYRNNDINEILGNGDLNFISQYSGVDENIDGIMRIINNLNYREVL